MGANNFVAFAGEASARLPKMDSAEGAIADEAIWIAESVALAQSVVHRDIPTDTHGTPVLLSSEYRISRGVPQGSKLRAPAHAWRSFAAKLSNKPQATGSAPRAKAPPPNGAQCYRVPASLIVYEYLQ